LNAKALPATSVGDSKLMPGPRVMARVDGTCRLGVCASASVISLVWALAKHGKLPIARAMTVVDKNECMVDVSRQSLVMLGHQCNNWQGASEAGLSLV
jgi:hypothetical protein